VLSVVALRGCQALVFKSMALHPSKTGQTGTNGRPQHVHVQNQIKLGDLGSAKQLTTECQQQQPPPSTSTDRFGIPPDSPRNNTGLPLPGSTAAPVSLVPAAAAPAPAAAAAAATAGLGAVNTALGDRPADGVGRSGACDGGGGLLAPQLSDLPLSERTGIIGTSFYIAPEILEGWASYDEKVWVGGKGWAVSACVCLLV